MLRKLAIQNYALIKDLELDFEPGMTAITGETGSGKSILLGALSLVLGERADRSALADAESKCIIEASFLTPTHFQSFFDAHDLDFEPTSIVRREITPAGKSRTFINDTPCKLSLLKTFGTMVIDIHSQMEGSKLTDRAFQFEFLDNAAGIAEKSAKWSTQFHNWKEDTERLSALIEEEQKATADLDYFRFQANELEEASLNEISLEDFENQLNTFQNAEAIQQGLGSVSFELENSENALIQSLQQLEQQLGAIADVHEGAAALKERLLSAIIELKDIAAEAEQGAEETQNDPAKAAELQEKLDRVYHLQNKHRVSTIEELQAVHDEIAGKIEGIDSLEDRISELREVIQKQDAVLRKEAKELHNKRLQVSTQLSKEIESELKSLKLPDASFSIQVEEKEELGRFGCSEIQLLFSANLGKAPGPFEKVASGGERSRVMLALKKVIAKHLQLPAMVFDEIDTGVSGEVAAKMAEKMEEMSSNAQIISITHLPQVAAKANHHIKVMKRPGANDTETSAIRLSQAQREEELAAMLSGNEITESARIHAKELLSNI